MVLAWHSSPVDSSLLMQRQTIDLTPRLFQWSLRPVVGVHLFPDCIKSGRCSPAPSVLLRFHAVHCFGREVAPNAEFAGVLHHQKHSPELLGTEQVLSDARR